MISQQKQFDECVVKNNALRRFIIKICFMYKEILKIQFERNFFHTYKYPNLSVIDFESQACNFFSSFIKFTTNRTQGTLLRTTPAASNVKELLIEMMLIIFF